MGFQLTFYFILLLVYLFQLISQAAESQQDICGKEVCGNVTILSPFGINRSCYNNTWFRVTCKDTLHGKRPFINTNSVDLEVLEFGSSEYILVNNPVSYVNCDHKNDASVSVNLTGTPFYFQRFGNYFGSVGCGNLAIAFNNEAVSVGGCIQPVCSDRASNSSCVTDIPEDLMFYTVSMRTMYPSEKDGNRCTSAFVFSNVYSSEDSTSPTSIDIKTTHVPARLDLNSSYCDDGVCQGPGRGPVNLYNEESCGNTVQFHYPFGINDKEYMSDWFRVTCKQTATGLVPSININGINLQLLEFSFLEGTVVVNQSVTYLNCRRNHTNGMSLNLTGSPFYFSNSNNAFWSAGCGNLVTVFDNEKQDLLGGCMQPSCRNNNETSFAFGCRVMFPLGLSSFFANMSDPLDSSDYGRKRSCGFASMIPWGSYFDLISKPEYSDMSNWTHVPTSLQWSTPISGSCHLTKGSNTSCSSRGEYCWQSLSPGHLCVCSKRTSYSYSTTCEEEICGDYKYCHMLCLNTPGKYCLSRSCPFGYEYNNTGERCDPKVSSPGKSWNSKIIIIGCSTSIGTAFLLLGTWLVYKILKTKQKIIQKQRFFKRNGGLLLQQFMSSNEGSVEKIRLFTSKEMEMATDYYNRNRILGEGGQGTVYKGMLTDGSIVAVKKSKMVKENKLDEKNVEQFINEVIILSQINHRNVVKLLGCCLEAQAPLLVFEFIPNGTLYDLIHHQNEEFSLTWEMRLRIAIEIANALFYLHSAASVPIYHRDIKSSNILLDDKFRAKVSDFGTSRSIALEQTHLTTRVQGTFGYMDPEYFRSSQFTEKSDVYSFGVVLVELLTGQKPISSKQSEEVRSLISYFLLAMQENSLFNILDSLIVNDGSEKEITAMAKLAKRCLNLNGKKRPTMKQVAMELELIKTSKQGDAIEGSGDEESEIDDGTESWDINTSCSTTRSITTDSVTLPLNASF